MSKILFHNVANLHHRDLSTDDDIHKHLRSLIILPEWDKKTINMSENKNETQVYYELSYHQTT